MRISDWSSDVCSSDLGVAGTLLVSSWMPLSVRATAAAEPIAVVTVEAARPSDVEVREAQVEPARLVAYTVVRGDALWGIAPRKYGEIGRATCRGRACNYRDNSVVSLALKKKTT